MEFLLTSETVFPLVMSFTRLNWLCGGYSVIKSCPTLATPWAIACQPLSRQEYGSGLQFPSPGDYLDPGIEPAFPAWQADSLPLSHLGSPFFTTEPPGKSKLSCYCQLNMNIWPVSSSPQKAQKTQTHPFRNESLSSDPVSWDRLFS